MATRRAILVASACNVRATWLRSAWNVLLIRCCAGGDSEALVRQPPAATVTTIRVPLTARVTELSWLSAE
jgi:hypothetical protein